MGAAGPLLICSLFEYTPFRSDDMKEIVRQTTEARTNFHYRYWKNVSDEGPHSKDLIRALLNPGPSLRLTILQALAHRWPTGFAAPTEHDLLGLRKNFDPGERLPARSTRRGPWRASRTTRVGFTKMTSGDEDDSGGGRGGSTSWRATPGSGAKRQPPPPLQPEQQPQQHQFLSPPSPDDRAPWRVLGGFVSRGAPKPTTSSPSSSSPTAMSFSEAIAKAKAAAETEILKKGGAPRAD